MTVSEGVVVMIPKHLGGVVPKYSAQWWERVSIVPAEESAKEENLPLSTAWSMPSYTYGRDAGTVKRELRPHVAPETQSESR